MILIFYYYSYHLLGKILTDELKLIIATLPGMYDRTVTVCSAGKAFSVTGWKVSEIRNCLYAILVNSNNCQSCDNNRQVGRLAHRI